MPQFDMDDESYERLAELARRRGVAPAVVLREGIELLIEAESGDDPDTDLDSEVEGTEP